MRTYSHIGALAIAAALAMPSALGHSAPTKLIASAPELLEALKGLLSSLEESGPWSGPNITAARAAIAKATT